jgi:hypothetical protein
MSTRYTGRESLKEAQDGVVVKLDDGGKLDFTRDKKTGLFRLTLITPRGVKLPAALITPERLRNIGEALVVLATQTPPEAPPMAAESEGDSRFSLLEIED